MSSDPKKFTKEQKTAIALKAVSGDDNTLQELAKEHGITAEEIKNWIREAGVGSVDDKNDVSLDVSDDFAYSVEFGVVPDKLNYPRLIFWSVFGTAVVLIMILAIMGIYNYSITEAQQQRSAESQFYEINQIKQNDRAKLDSFGVVDPEERIYRIPIDSAITIIAQQPDE